MRSSFNEQPLHDLWEFPIDNDLARKLFENPNVRSLSKLSAAKICSKCRDIDLWAEKLNIRDKKEDLEVSARTCDFCKLRYKLSTRVDSRYGPLIYFDKVGSHLRLNEGYPPVLTLHVGVETSQMDREPLSVNLQIGLPRLPQPGDNAHINIIKGWLAECDANHPDCGTIRTESMPKRLVHVGSQDSPTLRLYETKTGDTMKYLALSHSWGPPPHFRTLRSNIVSHKRAIAFEDAPLLFQNAVTTTRNLGLEFLWIDSLCIIQGEDGDFMEEAGRMEDIFSNAYCVLAASSASGSRDGFLKTRNQRESILVQQERHSPVAVCEFMDDFKHDVLESPLSRRGWVLQERALARRTIYFTDTQTYWECGQGVRCETMTRMQNTLASFLGDPNFPKVGKESTRGGKILLHQSLCKQYSRLALTRQTDRPIAISGLEKRLVEDFGLIGGFGILQDAENPGFLRRSMLWHRASDCPSLKKIQFDGVAPPTWSWMSYEGAIEYLDLPFAEVTWDEEIIQLWKSLERGQWHSNDSSGSRIVDVRVQELKLHSSLTVEACKMIIDIPDHPTVQDSSKCVVLGRLKGRVVDGQKDNEIAAILLVSADTSPSQGNSTVQAYKRIGVATVPARWIMPIKEGASKGLLV